VEDKNRMLRALPSVDQVLRNDCITHLEREYGHGIILDAIREELQSIRKRVLDGCADEVDFSDGKIIEAVRSRLDAMNAANLREVINGTGVVIHTNLGRAPLAGHISESALGLSARYINLEYDLGNGMRGSRHDIVRNLLCRVTGAEDGIVVNNNAAAVLLVLTSLAEGRDVIISRGQLVEIGGSFRVPEVMEQGGARLVEVGTTNKTYIRDYEKAIGEGTALLLKVHTSNYRIFGFTRDVTLEELVELGKKHGLPVVEDLGSGVLIDLSKYGLCYEPTVQQSVEAGADVVTFSGDKLLGGPQAGIIVGKREYIRKIAKHPLARAVRIDKLTLAALEGTLREYLDPDRAVQRIPVLRMLTADIGELERKADTLRQMLSGLQDYSSISVEKDYSQVGGGSLPLEEIETRVVSILPYHISVNKMEQNLRSGETPVVGRISRDRFIIDVRTVFDDQIHTLAMAIQHALTGGADNG